MPTTVHRAECLRAADAFAALLGDRRGAPSRQTAPDNRPVFDQSGYVEWPALLRGLHAYLADWEARTGVQAHAELEDGEWTGSVERDFAVYRVHTDYDPAHPDRGDVDYHWVRVTARGEVTRLPAQP